MWPELLAVSFWGGIVAMDTTAALQIMISRPLITSSITGLILGDFQTGLFIGIFLELLWINELPVGAARFSEGNIGATAAAAIAITCNNLIFRPVPSTALALITAVPVSIIGSYLVEYMRSINSRSFDNIYASQHVTIKQVSKAHLSGIWLAFLLGFLLTGLSTFLFGYLLLPWLIGVVPDHFDMFFSRFGITFLGVGCGVLIYMYIKNVKYWWLIFVSMCIGLLIF
ncbi:PTS sugar transporter subunit IIC [candidate division KSB1 bacterium]|nr:PTS sugar transporter subunit IIC [candidate division KSB1 bacterium]